MKTEYASRTTYEAGACAAFMRSRERYGGLSNMTSGFRLELNGLVFQGPEGLYQALKHPHRPDHQADIARQPSGMEAKKTAYRDRGIRPDWEEVKIDAMAYTLAVKLAQHPDEFGAALGETQGRAIVEKSYRDEFWGARPSPDGATLNGCNVLGKLLTELRDLLEQHDGDAGAVLHDYLTNVDASRLSISGRNVPEPTGQPGEEENMVNFDELKRIPKDCLECGRNFTAVSDEIELCSECRYFRENPEMAPGYWTWTKSRNGWSIRAKQRDDDEMPEPGATVTVHRKNGTQSSETIREVGEHWYDTSGYRVITCEVG